MKPISFHPAEQVYTLPGDDSVLPLPVLPTMFPDGTVCLVSCWKPGFIDLMRMLLGKPIYLLIHSPLQPPVSLMTEDLYGAEKPTRKAE